MIADEIRVGFKPTCYPYLDGADYRIRLSRVRPVMQQRQTIKQGLGTINFLFLHLYRKMADKRIVFPPHSSSHFFKLFSNENHCDVSALKTTTKAQSANVIQYNTDGRINRVLRFGQRNFKYIAYTHTRTHFLTYKRSGMPL